MHFFFSAVFVGGLLCGALGSGCFVACSQGLSLSQGRLRVSWALFCFLGLQRALLVYRNVL
jgi:hypothetical protein